eukprot:184769_1
MMSDQYIEMSFTEIILKFKQREKTLCDQIARRNRGLRLCQVELEEKDEELTRLKMLLENKNTQINVLQNDNNNLNDESIRHQKELFDVKSLLEVKGKELLDSNLLVSDANKNINELRNEINFLNNKFLQSENLMKKEIGNKNEDEINKQNMI